MIFVLLFLSSICDYSSLETTYIDNKIRIIMKGFKVRTPRTKMQNILLIISVVLFLVSLIIIICYGISFAAIVNCALFAVIFLSNYLVKK